jgi:hypothetical protein
MGVVKALAGGSLGCLVLFECGKTVPLNEDPTCPCATAAGWSCCDGRCVNGTCSEIDYMTQDKTHLSRTSDDAGSGGTSWYAYSDRTCPFSCPPLLMDGWAGKLSPGEDEPFFRSDAGYAKIFGTRQRYREVTGGGEKTWGVGFGFDFKDELGLSPVADCKPGWCTGTPAGSAAQYSEAMCNNHGTFSSHVDLVNESSHLGVSFWACAPTASEANPLTLEVLVSDKHTTAAADGIECDPCVLTGARACGKDYGYPVTLTPTWTQYVVRFSQLSQGSTVTGPPLDLTTLGHLNFEIQTNDGPPLPHFEVQVAYVEWADWVDDD